MNSDKNRNPAIIYYKDLTGVLTVNDENGRFQGTLDYFKSGWCSECGEDTYKNKSIGWLMRNRTLAHEITGNKASFDAGKIDEDEKRFQIKVMKFVRDAYRNQRLSAPKYRKIFIIANAISIINFSCKLLKMICFL